MSYLRIIFFLIVYIFFVAALFIPIYPGVQSYVTPGVTFADNKPVINEFVAHPSSGNKEWVEFYVPDNTSLNNYWIDDDTDFLNDSGSSTKKQITSVMQGSDSQHVIFELSSSMFNNDGDTVALFDPTGNLIDQYQYTSDPGIDVSIGRTPDATGDFQILASATRGSPNSSPKPTDTPTPAPTDRPTKVPKPTETPVPTKSKASSTSLPTITSLKTVLADQTTSSITNKKLALPTKTSSDRAHPTSILGANTKSVQKKITPSPIRNRVLIKGDSSSLPRFVAVSIGGLLLVACGILLYFKKRNQEV